MKKIFTLLTLALACVMQLSAQKLQITNGGEVVDCSTVGVITYTNAIQMGKKVSLGSREDPTITNISDQTITIDATLSTSNPGIFSWCGFDNFCTVVTNKAEKNGIVLAPGESKTMDLHTEVASGQYGTYTASVVFWEGYDKLATVQLKYIYTENSGTTEDSGTSGVKPGDQNAAQKLQITNGGEVVDCSTVGVITYTNAIQMGKKVSLGSREDPTITNISDQTITIDATLSTSNPGIFSWCGFDNFCTVVTNKAEKNGIVLAPGESKTMDLHTEVASGQYGTYTASVVFWEGYDKLATVQLKYIYTEVSGINDVKAEGQSVSVQNNTLSYSFSAAAARTINVYSIDGKLAKSLHTNNQQGQLSLNGLQQGVYLYAISQGGQQVATGKALVK